MASKMVYGEISWDSNIEFGGEGKGQKTDWMTLTDGPNKVRILSNPVQFYVHWIVDSTGAKRKVNCAIDNCPICKRGQDGDRAQVRWLVKVLDRKDSKIKLLEIGSQVKNGIKSLVLDTDWGKVTDYDINIKRAPAGTNPLYTVVPGVKAPLAAAEIQLLKDFNENVDVEKIVSPLAPEKILEKIGWTPSGQQPAQVSSSFSSNAAPKKPTVEFDFDAP